MSVSSTRKNFSASMALTSLANFSPSLVESNYWKFNHLREAVAIKFARQDMLRRRLVPDTFLDALVEAGSSALSSALARDSCHNVRPVFLEPGQSLRPVDDALERFPAWVLEGFRLKPLCRILNEFMQAFVSSPALEGLRNRGTGPPSLGQIDDARTVSLAEPGCGIELETDDIIGGMASSVDHWVSPFAGVDRAETSLEPNILVPAPALHHNPALTSHSRVRFRCRGPINP
jgi:hypothetical protein